MSDTTRLRITRVCLIRYDATLFCDVTFPLFARPLFQSNLVYGGLTINSPTTSSEHIEFQTTH